MSSDEEYRESLRRRPFRLQMSVGAASGFTGAASRGRCQFPGGCRLFEWASGRGYCRDHWLAVYQRDRLPDRWGGDGDGV